MPAPRGDCEIYVINADGTGTPVQVTNNSLEEFEPAISPNGTRVAFIRNSPDPAGNNQDVWIANADGTGVANQPHRRRDLADRGSQQLERDAGL